jgi:hypothetical protein
LGYLIKKSIVSGSPAKIIMRRFCFSAVVADKQTFSLSLVRRKLSLWPKSEKKNRNISEPNKTIHNIRFRIFKRGRRFADLNRGNGRKLAR